ncbi:MAG: hypothetical protein LC792_05245 [Actinobacteria bacterium]|nr:hypothetical protein [Actinomycetota bacterium]
MGPAPPAALELYIARAKEVWPQDELVEKDVVLRVRCQRSGHALAQRNHDADHWVAATAMASHWRPRRHLRNAPGLTLEMLLPD